MDRQLKKIAKSDPFKTEFWHSLDFLSEHSAEATRWGAIAVVAIALGFGIFFYMRHQASAREEALAQALRIDDATLGSNVAPALQGNLHFDTQAEKDQARTKAFADLAARYHGTQEGAIAEFYLGSDLADKGDLAGAEKRYKDVMDSAPAPYASLARLSMAQIYAAQGKDADAQKLLRDAIAHPSVTVSKDEATIMLAELIAKKNPAEAKKMLEPLQSTPGRTAVSRAAVQALADISQNNPK